MNFKSLCFLLFFAVSAFAQDTLPSSGSTKKYKGLYFSWGYNKEWYTKSDIHVEQQALGNNYTFLNTIATDKPGWTSGIFNKQLTIPQYNYRLGWMYNSNSAFELNFDHTKYQVSQYQNLHIKGTVNNRQVDTLISNADKKVLDYQLNNGANFFLFNWVKYYHIKNFGKNIDITFVSKQGIGFVYPHVENWIFGVPNTPHFQFGGFNIGYEAGVNIKLFKYFFLEYTNKLDYAWYRNLKINNGTIKQHFGTYEIILVAGVNIPFGKK